MPLIQAAAHAVLPPGPPFSTGHEYQDLGPGLSRQAGNTGAARRTHLARLRAQVRDLESGAGHGTGQGRSRRVLPFGLAALDRHLPGGGLPLAGLHEIEGERLEWDDGAATGFCLAILARLLAAESRGAVLWAAPWRDLYAPGLAAFGVDPGRLILVCAAREAEVLWALEEGLRCADLAAVVGEADGLDRTAGRRLQLAAESAGRPALVLRRGLRPRGSARHAGGAASSRLPSGALSRWRIAPAPSARVVCPAGQALDGRAAARLPGQARWAVELLRCRGAAPGHWDLEWDDATGGFALAAPVRDRALAAPAEAGGLRRAG
jgi:protein ImuA